VQYVAGSGKFASARMQLQGASGIPFTVRSPQTANEAGLATVSGSIPLGSNVTVSADAQALFGSDQREIVGQLRLGWKF
jgi:uncharacterized protein with beta-barrel porin domain